MKIFEIFGLSRSGHHAMTNWLIKNMCGYECEMLWKLNIMQNGVYYINEGNLDQDLTMKYIEEQKEKIRMLVISYENCDTNFSILNDKKIYTGPLSINNENVKSFSNNYRIIFLRDFYNNLASRIMSNQKKLSKTREGDIQPWNIGESFIGKWKNHARNFDTNDFISLKYENWLTDKNLRNIFMGKINGVNELYDNKVRGTHSSFDNSNDILNRIDQINLPNDIKDLLKSDNELHYLMGKVGYDYKKLI